MTLTTNIIEGPLFDSDWNILKTFLDQHHLGPAIEAFMFMAAYRIDNGKAVHAFKHVTTRRYLNLDADLTCYAYAADSSGGMGGYRAITSQDAFAHVLMSCQEPIS